MATIGEQQVSKDPFGRKRSAKWDERKDIAKAAGCVVGGIAVGLGALFALVYLVVLAVRLAWGA